MRDLQRQIALKDLIIDNFIPVTEKAKVCCFVCAALCSISCCYCSVCVCVYHGVLWHCIVSLTIRAPLQIE